MDIAELHCLLLEGLKFSLSWTRFQKARVLEKDGHDNQDDCARRQLTTRQDKTRNMLTEASNSSENNEAKKAHDSSCFRYRKISQSVIRCSNQMVKELTIRNSNIDRISLVACTRTESSGQSSHIRACIGRIWQSCSCTRSREYRLCDLLTACGRWDGRIR